MENNLIVQENKQLEGLEESKAAQIKAVFEPMVKMLEEFESVYTEVMAKDISPEKCAEAKRLRLDIAKIRIKADKVREEQKAEYLRAGNAIQGVYNILKFAVIDKEEKLKEVETYYERLEAEKIRAIQAEREIELSKYEVDGSTMDLGNMTDLVWNNFLAGTKGNYEAVKEAERRAEQERIEQEKKRAAYNQRKESLLPYSDFINLDGLTLETDEKTFLEILQIAKQAKARHEAEQEKIRQENERLRIEAEEKEKQRIAEEKKRAAEKAKQDEALRKEREAREKLEQEAKEKEAARIAAEKKAAAAPDKEKLFSVAEKLRATKITVKSPVALQALEDAAILLEKVAGGM